MCESPSGTILTNEVSKMTIKLSEETEPMSVEAGPSTRVALPPAISDDTHNLLVTRPKAPPPPPSAQQSGPNKGTKRQRVDNTEEPGPSKVDARERYPIETKKVYLTSKTTHRRKLQLAITLKTMGDELNKGTIPGACRLRSVIPMKITNKPGFKARWEGIVKQAETQLGHLLLERTTEQYNETKSQITGLQSELQDALEPDQFEEITSSLIAQYKRAAGSRGQKRNSNTAPRRQFQGRPQRGPNQQRGNNLMMTLIKILKQSQK